MKALAVVLTVFMYICIVMLAMYKVREELRNYFDEFHDRYGFWNFMLDAFLTLITGGLWIIVIIIRELTK